MVVPIDYKYRNPKGIFGPKPWCMVRQCHHKATRNLVYIKGKKPLRVCKHHQTDWVAQQFAKGYAKKPKQIPALYGYRGGYVVILSFTKPGDWKRMREKYLQQKSESMSKEAILSDAFKQQTKKKRKKKKK